jgi:uncharacterized coiled-coil DUF342 family protein
VTFPTSEHQAIYDLVNQRFDQLKELIMAEADALRTAIDNIAASIEQEIAQLAAAVDSASDLAALKDEVNASVARLQTLDDALKADDPVVPPTP